MNCRCHHRHSIFCLVPPYVLDQIALRGTPRQRAAALHTRSVDQTFRTLRVMAQPATAVNKRSNPSPMGPVLEKRRAVYNAAHQETLPGVLARAEGQAPTGDIAVDEAYEGLGATFDFYAEVFARDSIDDAGMPLSATVHFGQNYSNAFWNSEQMVFGDGDGAIFNRFTVALDVIGHELAHGVTEDEAQLQYLNQAGALNESMSDVFGSLIKQRARGQRAEQADWIIGEGLLVPSINGVGLRSMRAPGTAFDDALLGKDPQPAHMKDYIQTYEDNGGVHLNSGIPNHAFYQVATALGGHAWERAGRIWYETLRDPKLRPTTGFRVFARLTLEVAMRLYGRSGDEARAVREGWAAVGIDT